MLRKSAVQGFFIQRGQSLEWVAELNRKSAYTKEKFQEKLMKSCQVLVGCFCMNSFNYIFLNLLIVSLTVISLFWFLVDFKT